MPELYIIAGVAADGAIGRGGDLAVHSRRDMRYFKDTTMGHPVIMGRRTWQSLPKGALPGRRNIVITRDPSFQAEGAEVVHSLDQALELTRDSAEVPFVIGGAQIYAQAIDRASRLYLTAFDTTVPDADAHFPAVDPARWRLTSSVPDEGLTFNVWERTDNL